jgi:hypothetical protein
VHPAFAERTDGDVDLEDVAQEPRPGFSRRRSLVVDILFFADARERELLRRRDARLGVGLGPRHDVGGIGSVPGEDAVEADHVKTRRGHHCA